MTYRSNRPTAAGIFGRPGGVRDPVDGTAAHLTLCFTPDGRVDFYPEGDGASIERGLRLVVRALTRNPSSIACAAGTCGDPECEA